MSWNMNDQEFRAVLALPNEQRYAYFIKRVADWQELWALTSDKGWTLAADANERDLLPVWPHERYASACAESDWLQGRPASIQLSAWLDEWIGDLTRDGMLIAVFPTPSGKGVAVTPERLKQDLENERSLYGMD